MNKMLVAALMLASFGVHAQQTKACAGAEYRQFDFWIGEWDVFGVKGKQAGQSRIQLDGNGCFLLESWTGNGNVVGKSLNMYNAPDRQWHQSWYDSNGSRLELIGGLVDGKMVMASKDGAQRITWTPNADGTVRQHWESTKDQGKTWTTAFDGKYVKRAP